MPMLYEIRQAMLHKERSLGQVETIASLATQQVAVARLAVGTVQSGKFVEKWMLRPLTANTADRLRMVSEYNVNAGYLMHEGAVYTDVTATGEVVEIHEYEPDLLDNAIQQAIAETKFLSRESLPINNSGRYWLDAFPWITGPAEIVRLGRRSQGAMTRNRFMEQWDGYQTITAGALAPSYWTLGGTAALFSRQTTYVQRGRYGLQIVTSGGNVGTVDAVIKIIGSGVAADSLRTQTVSAAAVCRSVTASSQRVRITSEDAAGNVISTTNSTYHTGSGTIQEVSAQHTVATTAEQIRFQFRQEQNETGQLLELYGFAGTMDDSIRRDVWSPEWIDTDPIYEQGQPLLVYGPASQSGQFIIESYKPYPQFTQSRIDAGTADSDNSDAPLDIIAEGALFHLYAGLEPDWAEAKTMDAAKARRHWAQWGALRGQHTVVQQDRDAGMNFPPSRPQWVNGRVGRGYGARIGRGR